MTLSVVRSALSRYLLLGALFATLAVAAKAATTQGWVLLMPNVEAAETVLSTDVSEKDNLVNRGWILSGTGLLETEAGPDLALVHRMLRSAPKSGRRLALGADELEANLKEGFTTEGALGYVSLKGEQAGAVAVHRFRKGERLIWVCGNDEQYWAEKNGWQREGGIFWLKPTPGK